jgi:hypothetical protein
MRRFVHVFPFLSAEAAARALRTARMLRLAIYLPAIIMGVVIGCGLGIGGTLLGMGAGPRNPGALVLFVGPIAGSMAVAWLVHTLAEFIAVRRLMRTL